MKNLFDYLKASGNNYFSKKTPLNEIDSLIFARFAYLPFKKLRVSPNNKTISEIAKMMSGLSPKNFFQEDQKMINALSVSPRFQNLFIVDYADCANKKTTEQFTAITIQLTPDKLLISFIGTDDTVNGWRETCNMALMDEVPSQKSAKKYVKNIIKQNPQAKIYLCGHSKGGNLAMYSACSLQSKYTSHIQKVTSLDGPGLTKNAYKKIKSDAYSTRSQSRSIFNKITNYIPQGSIAGRLFFHAERSVVVKSANEKMFIQHNVYTWDVDLKTNTLVRTKSTTASELVDKSISQLIDGATKKQKKEFIDALFKILESSNFDTPPDIAAAGAGALPELFSSYRKLEKPERKIVFRAFKKLAKLLIKENKKNKTQKKEKNKK